MVSKRVAVLTNGNLSNHGSALIQPSVISTAWIIGPRIVSPMQKKRSQPPTPTRATFFLILIGPPPTASASAELENDSSATGEFAGRREESRGGVGGDRVDVG